VSDEANTTVAEEPSTVIVSISELNPTPTAVHPDAEDVTERRMLVLDRAMSGRAAYEVTPANITPASVIDVAVADPAMEKMFAPCSEIAPGDSTWRSPLKPRMAFIAWVS
jgi:hypothetical protein